MSVHDPAPCTDAVKNVHAVVVGIERYREEPGWDLPGAAGDATRFARWLLDGGVPAANVRVLLAPLDASRAMLDPQVSYTEAWNRDEYMNAFSEPRLNGGKADVLYVFWGGHGLLGHGDRRLLLSPDASRRDLRCIDANDLREYLTRTELMVFKRQVMLVDTCATFLEADRFGSGPALATFPEHPRRVTEQLVLHAAADGRVAASNAAARSGEFSLAVLNWFEGNASPCHADWDALCQHVTGHFEALVANGHSVQSPIALRVRTLAGSTSDLIVPRTLPPADPRLVAKLVLVLDRMLVDPEQRRIVVERLAAAHEAVDPALAATGDGLAALVAHQPRAMAAFTEVLFNAGYRDAAAAFLAISRSHGLPGLLSPNEFRGIRELLLQVPPVSHADLRSLMSSVFPLGAGGTVRAFGEEPRETYGPQALIDAVAALEAYAGAPDARQMRVVPVVLRFVEHIAVICPEVAAELHDWVDHVACRLGIDRGAVSERRADAAVWAEHRGRRDVSPPRLVVQLDIASGDPRPEARAPDTLVACVTWVDEGDGTLIRAAEQMPGPVTTSEVAGHIEDVIHSLGPGTDPLVEVVLSLDTLHMPVEAWDASDDSDEVPRLIGVERRLVLRCAPLTVDRHEAYRTRQLAARWRDREQRVVVHLGDSHVVGHAAYGALKSETAASRVVIHARPPGRERLLAVAVRLGYPVIIWDRGSGAAGDDTGHLAALRPDGSLFGLPERLRLYRAKSLENPDTHPVCPALLCEDADRPLPEVLLLTEPLEADRARA
ncbi:VMAP-C domain-containing protein [Streptodolium elevatio]